VYDRTNSSLDYFKIKTYDYVETKSSKNP